VQVLADLVSVLNEIFDKLSPEEMNSRIRLAEWRPLINLLHFLKRTSDQQNFSLVAVLEHSSEFDASSLCSVTGKVEEMLSQQQTNQPDDVAVAFLFSFICVPAKDTISGFPDLLAVVKTHFPYHLPFLSSILYLQHDYLAKIVGCWANMFFL
jgi:nucleolar pre-ribosomal-associated protein 1